MCIIGSDGHEFYLDEAIAELCNHFRMLLRQAKQDPKQTEILTIKFENIHGQVLEKIIQYLHYKKRYMNIPPKDLPPFSIEPGLAYKILQAAIYLDI